MICRVSPGVIHIVRTHEWGGGAVGVGGGGVDRKACAGVQGEGVSTCKYVRSVIGHSDGGIS